MLHQIKKNTYNAGQLKQYILNNMISKDQRFLNLTDYHVLKMLYERIKNTDKNIRLLPHEVISLQILKEQDRVLCEIDKMLQNYCTIHNVSIEKIKATTNHREYHKHRSIFTSIALKQIKCNILPKSVLLRLLGSYFDRDRPTMLHGLKLIEDVKYLKKRELVYANICY